MDANTKLPPGAENEPRAFEPWRYARTERAKTLVSEIIKHYQAEEDLRGWRRRARKPKDQKIFEATLEALVCDLAHVRLSKSQSCLTTTRSKRYLASGPPRYRAPAMTEQLPAILDRMHVLGHLVQSKGDRSCHAHVFTDEFGETRPRQATTIAVGKVLAWRIAHHGITFGDLGHNTSGEIIVLKRAREDRWDTADRIDYAETPETRRYREELQRYNQSLNAADIRLMGLPQVDASDRHLRRIFTNGSFKSGDRFAGGFWMNMERDLRLSRLLINGEKVASLDFAGLYPRLLYAREGKTPAHDDVYRFIGLEEYRLGMKRLLNARLFDRGARKSKPKRTAKEIREGVKLYPEHMSIGELLRIVEDTHRPIAHHFGTGIGHELQFVESQILMRILLELEHIGLGVHDCIIVPRSAVSRATEIMALVTRAEVGVVIPIAVEGGKKYVTTPPRPSPPLGTASRGYGGHKPRHLT